MEISRKLFGFWRLVLGANGHRGFEKFIRHVSTITIFGALGLDGAKYHNIAPDMNVSKSKIISAERLENDLNKATRNPLEVIFFPRDFRVRTTDQIREALS